MKTFWTKTGVSMVLVACILGLTAARIAGAAEHHNTSAGLTLQVYVLVDTSPSTKEVAAEIQAVAKGVVNALAPGDRFRLLSAHSDRPRVRAIETIGADKGTNVDIGRALEDIRPAVIFKADLAAALQIPAQALQAETASASRIIIFLLTDGKVDDEQAERILTRVQEVESHGGRVIVTGVDGANRSLLVAAAQGRLRWWRLAECDPAKLMAEFRKPADKPASPATPVIPPEPRPELPVTPERVESGRRTASPEGNTPDVTVQKALPQGPSAGGVGPGATATAARGKSAAPAADLLSKQVPINVGPSCSEDNRPEKSKGESADPIAPLASGTAAKPQFPGSSTDLKPANQPPTPGGCAAEPFGPGRASDVSQPAVLKNPQPVPPPPQLSASSTASSQVKTPTTAPGPQGSAAKALEHRQATLTQVPAGRADKKALPATTGTTSQLALPKVHTPVLVPAQPLVAATESRAKVPHAPQSALPPAGGAEDRAPDAAQTTTPGWTWGAGLALAVVLAAVMLVIGVFRTRHNLLRLSMARIPANEVAVHESVVIAPREEVVPLVDGTVHSEPRELVAPDMPALGVGTLLGRAFVRRGARPMMINGKQVESGESETVRIKIGDQITLAGPDGQQPGTSFVLRDIAPVQDEEQELVGASKD